MSKISEPHLALPPIRAVIFDLDGVIRHFAPSTPIDIAHGLVPGTVEATAFEPDVLALVTTGAITHDVWFDTVEARLIERHGTKALGAAAAFATLPLRVDQAVLVLSDQLRAMGILTAVLTNGTTRVEAEVAAHNIPEHFDGFFNSARIGFAKPDRRAFEHVATTLGIPPTECAFTDDSAYKMTGAAELGMHTHHYVGEAECKTWIRALGVMM